MLEEAKSRKSSMEISNEDALQEVQGILMQMNMSFTKHESKSENNLTNHLKRVSVGVTKVC